MKTLTGTWSLIRLVLRRDRIRLAVWILSIVGFTVGFGAGMPDLYPTAEARQARAQIMGGPIGIAFGGPRIGLDDYTFGAMLSNEFLGMLAVAMGLMSVFLVVRHTRVEEQAGRSELIRATPVGRHAAMTAALVVVAAAQVIIGVALAVLLPGLGLDLSPEGSWLFAAATVSAGLVFAGVAAITAQISGSSRGAAGMGAAAVGGAYVVRALGDLADSPVSMLSPIGWAQATLPFVDDTWWPLGLALVAFAGLTAIGYMLVSRRDFEAGLIATRPGPATAKPSLGQPFGLALRVQRGLLIGWSVGLVVLFPVYGSVIADVDTFASENPFVSEALEALGGATMSESWVGMMALFIMALVASFAVQAIGRLRSEEIENRAEPVLATPMKRSTWVGSHLTITLVGGLGMALLSAVGFGVAAAATTGDWSWVGKVTGGVVNHFPAFAVVAGFALFLFGVLPRLTGLAWALITVVWLGFLGAIIGLPEWLADLSPFSHAALVPATDVEVVPLLILTAIAAVLLAGGVVGFQRRDLTAT